MKGIDSEMKERVKNRRGFLVILLFPFVLMGCGKILN